MNFRFHLFLMATIAPLLSPKPVFAAQPATFHPHLAASNRALAQATPGSLCTAQLNGAIAPILKRSAVSRARWGILVQTLAPITAERRTLFARNPTIQLIPASNNKLFTTAAALVRLGQTYQIRTSVTGGGTSPNLATLRIIGRGDPALTTAQLTNLAQQLSQKGIRQITQLIGDDSYFRGDAVSPYWDKQDTLAGYGAAVNSLILNQNAIGFSLVPQRLGQPLRLQWDDPNDAAQWRVDNKSLTVAANQPEYVDAYRDPSQWMIRIDAQLRVGSASESTSVSVPNPGNYLVQTFRTALTKAGISVTNSTLVRTTPAPVGEPELAAIESPLLRDLIIEANQESNNVYAEALLKTLGNVQSPNNQNATESGVAAVKAALTPFGVNPNSYRMVDGSGLADRNRTNVEALVQLLQGITRSPEDAQAFRNTLPVAGESGTLKNRFRGTAAQGRLRAKTGYISGAVALSGYLNPPNYPPLVVSIIVNYPDGSLATIRGAVDDIVLVLTRLRSC